MGKKARHVLIGFALICISFLVACSGSDEGTSGDNDASSNDDAVELTFWKAEDVGRADYKAYMSIVEKFG